MYLQEQLDLSNSGAAFVSTVYPIFGGISALVTGFLFDRLDTIFVLKSGRKSFHGKRGLIMSCYLAVLLVTLGRFYNF